MTSQVFKVTCFLPTKQSSLSQLSNIISPRPNNIHYTCNVKNTKYRIYQYFDTILLLPEIYFSSVYLSLNFSNVFLLLTGTTFSTRIVFWVTSPLYISTVHNPDLKIHLSLAYRYFQSASLSFPPRPPLETNAVKAFSVSMSPLSQVVYA